MGVNTKAIIRKGTTLAEIKESLEQNYGEVKIHNTHENYFFNLVFNDSNTGNIRSLSVFFSNLAKSDYGIDGVLLSLGCFSDSVGIMKQLLNKFGGYLDEDDCDDEGFYPVNLDEYNKGEEFSKYDLFSQKVIQKLGYENLQIALDLFEEFKEIKED